MCRAAIPIDAGEREMKAPVVALLVTSVLALSACADNGETDRAMDTGEMPADMPQRDGTPGMGGMDMTGMQSAGMMQDMTSHMQMMQNVSADSMMILMPAHRQMGENMLEQMDEEMRAMRMQPDAQWNATADSVRQDMTRMPDMSAAELRAFMPEHRARMMRLMEMHRSMM
jgi:hypothetical protein